MYRQRSSPLVRIHLAPRPVLSFEGTIILFLSSIELYDVPINMVVALSCQ